MVICKYFQSGNCRFGSKCNNEHIDIKQIIKSEIEAAVRGSQWPLSCFGPFKEKSCIPDFIEDKSFDEIRYLYYEAKLQNCFPQYQQQVQQQVMEAKAKMNQLLTLTPSIINAVTQIYESNNETNKMPLSNPFSTLGSSVTDSPNIFGNSQTQQSPFVKPGGFGTPSASGNNLFQSSPLAASNQNSGNLFGASNLSSSNSIFGTQAQSTPQTNPFGGSFTASQPVAAGGNIFGAGQQNQTSSNSIFGASSTQSSNQPFGGSIFGGGGIGNPSAASGIFGGANQNTTQTNLFQQQNSSGNLFVQSVPQQSSLFAQTQNQAQNTPFTNQPEPNKPFSFSSFLQDPTQSQTQQQPASFNQSSNQSFFGNTQQSPTKQSIFAQAMQQQQQPSQNIFAQAGQPQFAPQPFAQIPQQQQQGDQQNLQFQLQNTVQSTFQQPNQAMLSTHQPHPMPIQDMSQQSLFSNVPSQLANMNAANDSQNIFAQAVNSLTNNNIQNFNQPKEQFNANEENTADIYSKLQNLAPKDIEAYKADRFNGRIPTDPPPRELCF